LPDEQRCRISAALEIAESMQGRSPVAAMRQQSACKKSG
jgi:hypothetical protein